MKTTSIDQCSARPLRVVIPATGQAGLQKPLPGNSRWLMPLALLCCLVPAASADQFGDFTYTANGTTITITAYTGAGGAVDIPASIVIDTVSKPVTSLGDAAFSGLTSVTSVTIPDSGTSGMIVVVEASTDLITWTPLQTISFTSGSFAFSDPALVSAQAARFYRPRMP